MITDVRAFARYFDGVHRRTVRDVSALPAEAEAWTPPAGDGEAAWGVPHLVRHISEARLFFASAFCGRGWVWTPWPEKVRARETWIPALEASAARLGEELVAAGNDGLTTRRPLIDDPSTTISGWRVLTMLLEHEVHHRSQIATYAGLQGWPVHQLFDRSYEWVATHQEDAR